MSKYDSKKIINALGSFNLNSCSEKEVQIAREAVYRANRTSNGSSKDYVLHRNNNIIELCEIMNSKLGAELDDL